MNYGIGLGADWDWNLLEGLIQDRGDQVIWETGVACPRCRKEDAVASFNERNPNEAIRIREVNCANCHGYGFIYRNATPVKGLITQLNAGNRQLIDAGIMMPGDCVFSPSLASACEPQDMDRITLCVTDVLHEGQTIQRNAAYLSNSRLRPVDLLQSEDRLWYAGSGGVVWCEDENNVVYSEGDFEIIDNKIRWVGKKPKDGVFYTLKYYYYPEWLVYSSPLQRVDRSRSLGVRVALRKKHIAYTQGTSIATPAQRQSEQIALTGRTKI